MPRSVVPASRNKGTHSCHAATLPPQPHVCTQPHTAMGTSRAHCSPGPPRLSTAPTRTLTAQATSTATAPPDLAICTDGQSGT